MKELGTEFEKYAVKHKGINSLTLHDYKNYVDRGNGIYQNTDIKNLTPSIVVESPSKSMAIMSVFDELMRNRIMFLGTEIVEEVTNIMCAQLLFLDSVETRDVNLYCLTGGGSVIAGNSFLDTMDMINSDVATTNLGMCASMGAVILGHGAKGKRSALKRSRTMIHQISSGLRGDFTEMKIQYKETEKLRQGLYETLAEDTNHTFEEIEAACDRDNWLGAKEALEFGIIDFIVDKKKVNK